MPKAGRILMAHGSGGQLSHDLVEQVFLRHFHNPTLAHLDDAAVLPLPTPGPRFALTTDSYVIRPLFFPGGDIGKLAVCGTVNDLAMRGAQPLYLTAGFILEEGLLLADLERIVASMAATAKTVGIQIVAGDTKVVERGSADGLFINTAGVGFVPEGVDVGGANAQPGDAVIVSGTMGDHGMAVMSQREGLTFSTPLVSDCAPLHGLVAALLRASSNVHCLRDPTRGGLATALNELARQSGVGIEIEEGRIAVRDAVRAMCELLGLDPLYVANEGKLVALVAPEDAEKALAALRAHEYGAEAAIVGRVTAEHSGRVVLRTALGARRIVDMLVGEQLPRIC
jgi:hydrogenase expression/formation protein HypE